MKQGKGEGEVMVIMVMLRGSSSTVAKKKNCPATVAPVASCHHQHPVCPLFTRRLHRSGLCLSLLFSFFSCSQKKPPTLFRTTPVLKLRGRLACMTFTKGGRREIRKGERGIYLTNRRLTCPPFIQPPSNSSKACINPPNPA